MNQYDFHPETAPPRRFNLIALLVAIALLAGLLFII